MAATRAPFRNVPLVDRFLYLVFNFFSTSVQYQILILLRFIAEYVVSTILST